jgi:hypothetical protein
MVTPTNFQKPMTALIATKAYRMFNILISRMQFQLKKRTSDNTSQSHHELSVAINIPTPVATLPRQTVMKAATAMWRVMRAA